MQTRPAEKSSAQEASLSSLVGVGGWGPQPCPVRTICISTSMRAEEISEAHSRENKKHYLFKTFPRQGGQPPSLVFGSNAWAGRRVGELSGGGGAGFRYALMRSCWFGQTAAGVHRSRASLWDYGVPT